MKRVSYGRTSKFVSSLFNCLGIVACVSFSACDKDNKKKNGEGDNTKGDNTEEKNTNQTPQVQPKQNEIGKTNNAGNATGAKNDLPETISLGDAADNAFDWNIGRVAMRVIFLDGEGKASVSIKGDTKGLTFTSPQQKVSFNGQGNNLILEKEQDFDAQKFIVNVEQGSADKGKLCFIVINQGVVKKDQKGNLKTTLEAIANLSDEDRKTFSVNTQNAINGALGVLEDGKGKALNVFFCNGIFDVTKPELTDKNITGKIDGVDFTLEIKKDNFDQSVEAVRLINLLTDANLVYPLGVETFPEFGDGGEFVENLKKLTKVVTGQQQFKAEGGVLKLATKEYLKFDNLKKFDQVCDSLAKIAADGKKDDLLKFFDLESLKKPFEWHTKKVKIFGGDSVSVSEEANNENEWKNALTGLTSLQKLVNEVEKIKGTLTLDADNQLKVLFGGKVIISNKETLMKTETWNSLKDHAGVLDITKLEIMKKSGENVIKKKSDQAKTFTFTDNCWNNDALAEPWSVFFVVTQQD